jgi:predicted transcriptional regulator
LFFPCEGNAIILNLIPSSFEERFAMVTTSIVLTEQEHTALHTIAQQTGKTQGELLREALEQFIAKFQQTQRQTSLQQARGMWKDRNDLPSVEARRREFDRLEP